MALLLIEGYAAVFLSGYLASLATVCGQFVVNAKISTEPLYLHKLQP